MRDDVEMPARPDAHPGAAGRRGVRVGRTVWLLSGWAVALALSACGGGGSEATPPAAGASASPAAASGVTVSGPDGASLFVPASSPHGNRMTAVGEAVLVMNSSEAGVTWTTGPTVPFGQLWGVDFAGPTTFVSGAGGVLARHD